MTREQQIIKELDGVIAYADLLKDKAERLRKKLARVHEPASRKRAPAVSEEVIAKILMQRHKNRLK